MTAVTTDQASTLSKSTFSKSQSPLWGAVALLQLALLGIGAGLVCWPLNLVDRLQDALVRSLPAFGGGWDGRSVALLLLPLPVMPLLLLLQTRLWPLGAGSGIPQTLVHLARPASTPRLMAAPATLQRLTSGAWPAWPSSRSVGRGRSCSLARP